MNWEEPESRNSLRVPKYREPIADGILSTALGSETPRVEIARSAQHYLAGGEIDSSYAQ